MKIIKKSLKYKIRRLLFIYIPTTIIIITLNVYIAIDFLNNIDAYMM